MKFTLAAIEKLQDLWYSDNQPEGLRVSIAGGGCAGFQYLFTWGDKESDDLTFHAGDVPVFIDSMSMQYLANATMDYEESTMESKFIVQNPDVQTTCGCGSSFNPY